MIDIEKAKKAFDKYVNTYDTNNVKIRLKITHTYNTINAANYITEKLGLDKENRDLAELIALLHDIGRFEQLKIYDSYEDFNTVDHADFGLKVLEEGNLLREFIEEETYDNIIKTAIKYHNKFKVPEDLDELSMLHTKIIRDADKLDNFNVKQTETTEALYGVSKEEFEQEAMSPIIYETYLSKQLINSKERVTNIDAWVGFFAFIFDFNFPVALEYIKEKNYINIIMDRFEYKNEDTNNKMKQIKKVATEYIEEKTKM